MKRDIEYRCKCETLATGKADRQMTYPKQPERLQGWQIEYKFLQEVKQAIKSQTDENISLEAIEDVLIAAEKVMKRGR